MSFPTHNCLAAIQALFRHLGVRQITRSTVIWLVLIAMSFAMTACNTPSAASPSPTTPPQSRIIVATRWTALLIGKLGAVDGCLRVNDGDSDTSYLLVWPPDQHTVSVEKDTVQIVDRLEGKTVVWHIGEMVHLGGGEVPSIEYLDERLRQKLPANCPGPYWVVGGVTNSVEATEESAVPPVTQSAEEATPVILTAEEALRRDAQEYASHFGVDLDEAIRRMRLQGTIGGLGAELAEKERDTFAGLWFQHTPEFRLVVQFTRDGEETIQQYIEGKPFADIVEVRTASVTLAELKAAREQAAQIARELGIPCHSGTNVSENRAELYVTDRARFDAALREAGIQLPYHVVVVTIDE